jgi:pantothenate kinase
MTPDLLEEIAHKGSAGKRLLIAIAGPPGAGKSTLAQALVQHLPTGTAMVLEMDGFHYDNAVLDQLGLRARKGAPETFDFAGFAALVARIQAGETGIAIPVFDRRIDLARAGAAIISPQVKFVIAEGNYLLLDEAPWAALAENFDLTVFVDVEREELRHRLLRRWADLGDPPEKAEHWVRTNDMPNVDRVLAKRLRPDFCLACGETG